MLNSNYVPLFLFSLVVYIYYSYQRMVQLPAELTTSRLTRDLVQYSSGKSWDALSEDSDDPVTLVYLAFLSRGIAFPL